MAFKKTGTAGKTISTHDPTESPPSQADKGPAMQPPL